MKSLSKTLSSYGVREKKMQYTRNNTLQFKSKNTFVSALLKFKILLLTTGLMFCEPAFSQVDGIHYERIGKIKPRSTLEIEANNWSIGAETMDRHFTIYENWKAYLAPLGFKKARIQSGWARTERKRGVYDFGWLDSIVFDMAKQGVTPWMNVGYGNDIYEGGGGITASASVPSSPEALEAWDNWVQAMVNRYKKVIYEWEVWNEPNYHVPVDNYVDILIRTAEIVKREQPEGKILAISSGSWVDYNYTDKVLQRVAEKGKLDLIDEITFHRHRFVPEDYEAVDKLRAVVDKYDSRLPLRQGESGAPTMRNETRALNNYDWTEVSASKWALRRLLGDLARDLPSSYFGIMEMKYPAGMNAKGLLESSEDQHVIRPKQTYYALQNLASIFDHNLSRIKNYPFRMSSFGSGGLPLSVHAYKHTQTQDELVVVWLNNGVPNDFTQKIYQDLSFEKANFNEPVYIDLRTGDVYELAAENWEKDAKKTTFFDVPIYDSPILLAEKSVVLIDGWR